MPDQKIKRAEFEQIILSDDLFELCSSPDIARKLTSIASSVLAMVGFDQRNPHHCYDLWEHSLHTVNNLDDDGMNPYDVSLLKTAAFFHDIGKTLTSKEKDGRLVFYGHAAKSAELVIPILEGLGYTDNEINRIVFLIANHDMFISFVLPADDYDKETPYLKEINKSNVTEAIAAVSSGTKGFSPNTSDYLILLKLCFADVKSQADKVFGLDGRLTDSRQHKLAKLAAITQIISSLTTYP